ncbi:Retrotrans-gag domain containing protein [Ceratocystis lukuohia]|uniref:Retrotrans-gag domain containing protein n=1 Tax=Ceratocystis lukuohia TaxID=2019550 RepID=A0ABR4MJZ2_9PEZI
MFERHLAQAGGLDWPDQSKIAHLNMVLNPTLKTLMSFMNIEGMTFAQYCETAMRCSLNPDGPQVVVRNLTTAPPAAPRGEPMDWSHTYASNTPRAKHQRPTHDAKGVPYATDQELQGGRAKWVTKEELAARRAARVCLRCARPGCGTSRCPLKPAINPATRQAVDVRAVQTATLYSAQPASLLREDTEEEDNVESEN